MVQGEITTAHAPISALGSDLFIHDTCEYVRNSELFCT